VLLWNAVGIVSTFYVLSISHSIWPNAIIYYKKWYHIVGRPPQCPVHGLYYHHWLLYVTSASSMLTIISVACPTVKVGIHNMMMYLEHGWWRHWLGCIIISFELWLVEHTQAPFMLAWGILAVIALPGKWCNSCLIHSLHRYYASLLSMSFCVSISITPLFPCVLLYYGHMMGCAARLMHPLVVM